MSATNRESGVLFPPFRPSSPLSTVERDEGAFFFLDHDLSKLTLSRWLSLCLSVFISLPNPSKQEAQALKALKEKAAQKGGFAKVKGSK